MNNYIRKGAQVDFAHSKRSNVWALITASVLAITFGAIMLIPALGMSLNKLSGTQSDQIKANAFIEMFCGADIGTGMDSKQTTGGIFTDFSHADAPNRKWTLQEAYGGGMGIVSFQGIGAGSAWVIPNDRDEDAYKPGNYEEVAGKLEEIRNPYTCSLGAAISTVSTLQLKVASFLTSFTNTVVAAAVSDTFICSEAGQDGCIDVLGIIGGASNDDDTSIAAALGNSIFMPLMILAVAVAAVSIAYQGIAKRQFREAFGKALWVVSAAVLGVIVISMPHTTTQAPSIVANAFSSCVIGAFNGENCLTDDVSNGDMESVVQGTAYANVCNTSADGIAASDQMSMTVETLGCTMWRAFVLEPYADASFGMSYNELSTMNEDNTALRQLIDDAGLEPEMFCINMKSSGSAADNARGRMDMDGGTGGNGEQICNLAAYQMFLAHDTTPGSAHDAGGVAPEQGEFDERWYNLAVLAAHDDSMWQEWSSNTRADIQKLGTGFTAIVAAIVGSILLIFVSFNALLYKLGGMVLIALAALFLLFMIEPTRGRRMATSYFGQLVSTVFKYMASVLFLMIALTFYGALLGSMGSGIYVNLLLVVLLTAALLMFHSQFIELLGKVDRRTEIFTDKISERVKGTTSLAGTVAMGGVGAKAGGGDFGEGLRKTFRQEMASGRGKQAFGETAGGMMQSGFLAEGAMQRFKHARNAKAAKSSGSNTPAQSSGSNTPASSQSGGTNTPAQSGSSNTAPTKTSGSQSKQGNAPAPSGNSNPGSSQPSGTTPVQSGSGSKAPANTTGKQKPNGSKQKVSKGSQKPARKNVQTVRVKHEVQQQSAGQKPVAPQRPLKPNSEFISSVNIPKRILVQQNVHVVQQPNQGSTSGSTGSGRIPTAPLRAPSPSNSPTPQRETPVADNSLARKKREQKLKNMREARLAEEQRKREERD